jgi:hypothetical protein
VRETITETDSLALSLCSQTNQCIILVYEIQYTTQAVVRTNRGDVHFVAVAARGKAVEARHVQQKLVVTKALKKSFQ